jgi:hypothetical protein
MSVRYWDYFNDTSSTTTNNYYNTWSTSSTSTWCTGTTAYYTTSYYTPPPQRYIISGFDGWSDAARAVLTRLINDETNTGFKVTLWIKGDVEITDPGVMHRDLDWFLLRLRQVATAADYQKIADHVAQVRAELDDPTAEGGDAQ